MMTFLPFGRNFRKNAEVLDPKRLNKQIVEIKQILNALEGEGKRGWSNHPAVLMWEGYEELLKAYYNVLLSEFLARGYAQGEREFYEIEGTKVKHPWWIDWKSLQYSHMASLVRKHPFYYTKKFGCNSSQDRLYPKIYDQRGYIWPSKIDLSSLLLKAGFRLKDLNKAQKLLKPSIVNDIEEDEDWFAEINWSTSKNSHKSKQNSFTKSELVEILEEKGETFPKSASKKVLFEMVFPGEWVD